MNEKFPSCLPWYNDTIIKLSEDEIINLNSQDYFNEYLHSEYWKQVREKYFEKFDKVCAECPAGTKNKIIQLHHKGYSFDYNSNSHKLIFGRERYSDLMPLCQKHHQEKHLRTANGDRVMSSSNTDADVRYIGFFIGKYIGEKKPQIHVSYTAGKGVKVGRGSKNGQSKVNDKDWYAIYYIETTASFDDVRLETKKLDGMTQEDKKIYLIENGVSETEINFCLLLGFVPKNRDYSSYNDLLEEIN